MLETSAFLSITMNPTPKFELQVYPKISRGLGISTRTEVFKTREEAEARKREIEAMDPEHRLDIEITELKNED
ncbi:MAG: hypothetical protein PHX83_15405 [Acidobacteriia bacterium]|nr:hypothetical protein [Terriglobia bacterium]